MSKLTLLRRLILSGWCYSSLPGVVGRLSQIQELDFRFVFALCACALCTHAFYNTTTCCSIVFYMKPAYAVIQSY